VALGSGAGAFAKSLGGGPGIHAESTGNAPALDGVALGSGAGAFAKSLGGGPGIHAESTGDAPALDGVALGSGPGVFAKSLGGGAAAFLDGNVHVTGTLSVGAVDVAGLARDVADLRDRLDQLVLRVSGVEQGTAQSLITLADRVTRLEMA
jgi:hypothetical protein